MKLDIIGDVHGCYHELVELLEKLGYSENEEGLYIHPEGRKIAFVGDIVDRGPQNMLAFGFVYKHFIKGECLWVQGNHDNKFFRWLMGNKVKVGYGLENTIKEIGEYWPIEGMSMGEVGAYLIENVPFLIDGEGLTIVHAAPPSTVSFPLSKAKRAICLYGYTTGKYVDGFPERLDWTEEYHGDNFVVYGHMCFEDVYWNKNTVCIDTGCFAGRFLTALRWPEKEIVQVAAHGKYQER